MKSNKKKIFKAVTVTMAVIVVLTAVYIMINRLGLVDGYDFGLGAYYYVDIPDYEKIVDQNAFKNKIPLWIYFLLFFAWGWLMWRLWQWIDSRK